MNVIKFPFKLTCSTLDISLSKINYMISCHGDNCLWLTTQTPFFQRSLQAMEYIGYQNSLKQPTKFYTGTERDNAVTYSNL